MTTSVDIYYNVSEDCVSIHHGVRIPDAADREKRMRPLARCVQANLQAMLPACQFRFVPLELPTFVNLLMPNPAANLPPIDGQVIETALTRINYDHLLPLPIHLAELHMMSDGEIAHLHRLQQVRVFEPLTLLRILDQALLAVEEGVGPFSHWDVLMGIADRLDDGDPAWCRFIPSTDRSQIEGVIPIFILPSTLGLIVHEITHIVVRLKHHRPPEKHGRLFVAALGRVLAELEDCGWEERAGEMAAQRPAEASAFGPWSPSVGDERWRMVAASGTELCAAWRADSVERWGDGTVDNPRVRSWVERCLTRSDMKWVDLPPVRR